jgi:hypothetical protein
MLLTLLTVTIVAVGGPPLPPVHPGAPSRTRTFAPFAGATVRIARSGHVIASSEEGNISVRVRPGTYVLTAEDPNVEPFSERPHPCYQGRSLGRTVRVGHRPKSVKLYCQIK